MTMPPVHLKLINERLTVHLVAFVNHEALYEHPGAGTKFFLGFYIKPRNKDTHFYVCHIDETGKQQRKIIKTGKSVEHAFIVATAAYNIDIRDVKPYQTFCQERLFVGKQNREMSSYKRQLSKIRKRIENLSVEYAKYKTNSSR